jgi:hypothetical protein
MDILLLNEGVILLVLLNRKRIYLYRDYIFKVVVKDLLRDYKEYNIRFIFYNFNFNNINIILKYL